MKRSYEYLHNITNITTHRQRSVMNILVLIYENLRQNKHHFMTGFTRCVITPYSATTKFLSQAILNSDVDEKFERTCINATEFDPTVKRVRYIGMFVTLVTNISSFAVNSGLKIQ